MNLTGTIEDLPVTDILQLLHVSGKTGRLDLFSENGTVSISISHGAIVSASNSVSSMSIGLILFELGYATKKQIVEALSYQTEGSKKKKPIVQIMIERGFITKQQGWEALKLLIAEIVKDIASWKSGKFTFVVDEITLLDDFKVVPTEIIESRGYVDTQNILLETIKVLDEKDWNNSNSFSHTPQLEKSSAQKTDAGLITAPSSYLDLYNQHITLNANQFAVVVFSENKINASLLSKTASILCLTVVTVTQLKNLTHCANELMEKKEHFISLVDISTVKDDGNKSDAPIRAIRELSHLSLSSPIIATGSETQKSYLAALEVGAHVVINYSQFKTADDIQNKDTFRELIISHLRNSMYRLAKTHFENKRNQNQLKVLRNLIVTMFNQNQTDDVLMVVLKYVSTFLNRCLVFLVRNEDLIAIGAFGVEPEQDVQKQAILQIPKLDIESPLLESLLNQKTIFFGTPQNDPFVNTLYQRIHSPKDSEIVILPLRVEAKTIAIIYGDFGEGDSISFPTEALEILTSSAGISLELELSRRRLSQKETSIHPD